MDDGSPSPNLTGKIGADVPTILKVNGVSTPIKAGEEIDVSFNMAGTLGIESRTFQSLIQNTFQ
jgi:hypothetical protein